MQNKATILRVDDTAIWVVPVIENMCISCERASQCAKRGTPFRVDNPQHLEISAGDTVDIGAARRGKTMQALAALVLPITAAAAGYFAAPSIAGLLGLPPSDAFRAAAVLAFLFGTSLLVLLAGRFAPPLARPYVESVISKV
jgi:hypothetical protein